MLVVLSWVSLIINYHPSGIALSVVAIESKNFDAVRVPS